MRIRWRGLELPTNVELDREVSTDTYGLLSIEPFERGFGITLGNSLRRILLSSLEGSAVTSVKIDRVPHEFSTLPGVIEDISDIILNIKAMVVKLNVDDPRVLKLRANKAGVVTASHIEADPAVSILNPDHVIATLSDDVELSIDMTVQKGRGYKVASEDPKAAEREVGIIPIDAVFSPVTRVRYKTEETRVGQLINYDRLIMEIWTDGTIGPEMALVESAKILRKHLGPIVQYFELGEELAPEQTEVVPTAGEAVPDEQLQKKLNLSIQELELSVRAGNCLDSAKIETVGQLAAMTESELLALRSFGKTSLREVKRKLADLGLTLGFSA